MQSYKKHLDLIKEYYEEKGILYTFNGGNSLEIYEKILLKMQPNRTEKGEKRVFN